MPNVGDKMEGFKQGKYIFSDFFFFWVEKRNEILQ